MMPMGVSTNDENTAARQEPLSQGATGVELSKKKNGSSQARGRRDSHPDRGTPESNNSEARPPRPGGDGVAPTPDKVAPTKFLSVFFMVFTASLLAGVLAGKAASPRYNDPEKAMGSIEDYVFRGAGVLRSEWQRKPDAGATPISELSLSGGVVEFHCGFKTVHRDLITGKAVTDEDLQSRPSNGAYAYMPGYGHRTLDHSRAYLPPIRPSDPNGVAVEGASPQEVVGVIMGAGELYSLTAARKQAAQYWKNMGSQSFGHKVGQGIKMFAAGLSGFALGFYFAYDDSPCRDRAFQDQLDQQSLWIAVGELFRRTHSWHFQRDSTSRAISAIKSEFPVTLSSFYYSVKAAQLEGSITTEERDRLRKNSESADPLQFFSAPVGLAVGAVEAWGPAAIRNSARFQALLRAKEESSLWQRQDNGTYKPL